MMRSAALWVGIGVTAAALGLSSSASAAPPTGKHKQLVTQGRHYLRLGRPKAALDHLEEALLQPGSHQDRKLILAAAKAYRQLGRLGDAADVLERGKEHPRARRALETLRAKYGPVRVEAAVRGTVRGWLSLQAVDLIGVAKKEVFRSVKDKLQGELEFPLKVWLPYGTYMANGELFEHTRRRPALVDTPMRRIAVVTDHRSRWRRLVELALAEIGGQVRQVVVESMDDKDLVAALAPWKPHVVLALGPGAAQMATWVFHDTPIAFARVPKKLWRDMRRHNAPVTGVADDAPWGAAVSLFRRLAPDVKTIGIVMNPGRSKQDFPLVQQALKAAGLGLGIVPVSVAAQVPASVRSLAPKVDALWVLPDPGLWSDANLRVLLDVARRNKLATFGFDDRLVDNGGFLSMRAGDAAVARTLGRIAASIVREGKAPLTIPIDPPKDFAYVVNVKVAAELSITLSEDVLEAAARVLGDPRLTSPDSH